jgi:arylsulfatase A-like enzyme
VAKDKVEWSHDLIIDAALRWIEGQRERPFFLYFAPTIPHANNEALRSGAPALEVPDQGIYAERRWPEAQKNYAALVSRLDADVGRLLDLLARLGIDEETVVFFSSDNGPHREGGNDPAWSRSSGGLRGIKRDLYEGGIRVPAIVRWPGTIPAGVVSSLPWAFWDFLPTAAELAGIGDAVPAAIDGRSVLEALRGQPMPGPQLLYWELYEKRHVARAVRAGRFKLIEFGGHGGRLELYDLEEDPRERQNLAARRPQLVRELLVQMYAARTPDPRFAVAEFDAQSPGGSR